MDGENGMKPAWLLRHKTEPIEGRGFALGARVRIQCTYQVVRRKQVNQKAKALFTELEK